MWSFWRPSRSAKSCFTKTEKAGLNINTTKSNICKDKNDYLGYLLTREGIKLQPKKVSAIQNMTKSKTRKQLRAFLGLVNYYRDMTQKRSELIAPLTGLTPTKLPFIWTKVEAKHFEK